jgi:type IV pilus assembly protein PilW
MKFLMHQRHAGRTQGGLTLVELMVALAIGAFLIAGAVSVFAKTRDLYRTNEDAARLQETARYAMSIIEADLRMANYWGLNSRPDLASIQATSAQVSTACGADWAVDLINYVDGVNGDDTTGPYASHLGCAATGTLETSSDVLTVRRAGVTPLDAGDINSSGGRLKIASARIQSVVFSGTAVPTGFLQTRNLFANSYYVARDPAPGDPVVGQPELRRKHLNTDVAVLQVDDELVVPGIEDLQFQVGVDTDADQSADFYINPDDLEGDVPPGAAIVAVRVWLLTRAERPDFSFRNDRTYQYADRAAFAPNDQFRRVLVSKTVQLRNTQR